MSLDDLTDVIASEAVPLTITRAAAPTMTYGRPVGASSSDTFPVRACVQPVPTKELQLMPEGMRNRGMVKVYSPLELQVLPMPDCFEYLGATWEIVKVDDWSDLGNYWRCFAARVTMS